MPILWSSRCGARLLVCGVDVGLIGYRTPIDVRDGSFAPSGSIPRTGYTSVSDVSEPHWQQLGLAGTRHCNVRRPCEESPPEAFPHGERSEGRPGVRRTVIGGMTI
jgi:hypothetical protein